MTDDQSARLKLVATIVLGTAACAAALWSSRHPRQPNPPQRATEYIYKTAGRPQPAPPVEPAAAPAPPPATDRPESSPLPLEDLIAQTMPSIYRIGTPRTRGSGFVAGDGLVVTNAHVVLDFTQVTLTSQHGEQIDGYVVVLDKALDLAVIRARLTAAPTLSLANSTDVRLGEGVVAMGWAESLDQSTVTRGIVTGLRRSSAQRLVQTDAVPNPGDSGGPLVDKHGRVVGVTTFRMDSPTDHAGFAVAVDDLKPLLRTASAGGAEVPQATPPAPVQQPSPSTAGTDDRRAAADQRFTEAVQTIARHAEVVDDGWSRYKTQCGITSVPRGVTREWFNLYDPGSPLQNTSVACIPLLTELKKRANAIADLMNTADEAARREGVLPGTRRDIRAHHRLDYAGWDR